MRLKFLASQRRRAEQFTVSESSIMETIMHTNVISWGETVMTHDTLYYR